MLRRSSPLLDSFKEHYHRVHLPRRLALQRYIRQQRLREASGKACINGTEKNCNKSLEEVPYKYNRWWVNEDHEFVHQYAVVEDPLVTRAKREALPPVTKENIWKDPQQTFFLPFAPYIRVMDYPNDPDSKFLRPVNVPRWKDYMQRTKPVVPRTWY
ncbi:hypothetical protein TRVL_02778 [Trypanosoma vivax]|uniref:Uncharacterized protein n=1 Tax=Trypanosoma vivax (strain Y486) TaxID=1055687 RepID=G0U853_TRYVY|nr:hypothetical protein TRVL_02778 [Trypanosoma vivax]CCC52062.1 conserved hypothetical protein [Trypanosoma vivax Y486]